ncbi:uncharacterized protein LOC126371551 [Pectinophora gossypiella]|uniref:uncharacterized protein LOC126371551 n=1 Tax=Pectinophora gossypiella TaxID=13191 RepID=UPI00214E1E7D|nr:uncharacterized protein LOC126371551 [Pectinophora gossypiella]
MAAKVLSFLLLVAVASQGYAQTINEVALDDQHVSFISHPLYARVITIPKSPFDTLLACYITFPSGVMYEAYPNSNIPFEDIMYASATPPFNTCAVGFRGVPASRSGSYELRSLVQHDADTLTLARQTFHLTITESEVGMP